jgi:hypothetical protein
MGARWRHFLLEFFSPQHRAAQTLCQRLAGACRRRAHAPWLAVAVTQVTCALRPRQGPGQTHVKVIEQARASAQGDTLQAS